MLVMCWYPVYAQSGRGEEHSDAFRLFIEGATIQEALTHRAKCGLPFITEVRANWDRLSELQQMQFTQQFERPVTDTYMISPNGYFRIHYDTSGTHAPDLTDTGGNGIPDYIDSTAAAFDYSYEILINQLGYDAPVKFGEVETETGDTIRYDVYVRDVVLLYGNVYGLTNPYGDRINDDEDPVPRYRAYIVVDNSYDHTPTTGIDGLKVTAAHELHHVIQIGSYGYWLTMGAQRPTRFFYEITSTWLEDVIYPDINDYYYYLPVLFIRTIHNFPFSHSSGLFMYARAIWGHMMERRYGGDIMREKWEYIRKMHPIDAIDRALRDHGSTLEQELAEFNLWKFYTGARARPENYFIDGADYPMLTEKTDVVQHMGETMFRDVDVSTQTLHFHSVVTDEQDTVFFLIGNVDKRIQSDDGFYELTVFSQQRPNTIPIGNGLWYSLESNNPSAWKVIPVYTDRVVSDERVSVYPNPFDTGQASSVAFVIDTDKEVEITILSSDMRLVYRDMVSPEQAFGRTVFRWNGRDNRNRLVASGVYVYVLQYGDTITKGKITVIRE